MSVSEREGQATSRSDRRRRRLWSAQEKRRIVAETLEPGASVSVVARRHDLNANMLFTWRREAGVVGSNAADSAITFVPATIAAEPATACPPGPPLPAGRIEIALAGGDRVIVGADVDAAALARVVEVLSRR